MTKRTRRLGIEVAALAVAILAALSRSSAQTAGRQVPTREGASATAVLKGRVTAAANGAAIPRVRLTLTGPIPNPITTVSDTRGDFEITGVPAGVYTLTATRTGYLTIQYGQTRPRQTGRTIHVRASETIEGLDFALRSAASVAGRITDDVADPFANVKVEALETRTINGRRVSVPVATTHTNDLGDYLLSGLPPGRYTVRASSASEAWQDEGPDRAVMGFAPTYFPGSSDAAQATSFTVGFGDEVNNVDFSLAAVRAVRISGRVERANGEPVPGATVGLSRIERTVAGELMSSASVPGGSAVTVKEGSFQIRNMLPGEYLLRASLSPADAVTRLVTVLDTDVTNIVLAPRPDTPLAGTVTTDEDRAPPFGASRLRIAPVAAPDDVASGVMGFEGPQPVAQDWTFRFADIDGAHVFRVTGLPDEWTLKTISINGRDVTDTPFEVQERTTARMRVVLTRKSATVNGAVVTAQGAPAIDATILVFAEDAARWGIASRFLKSVRPDRDGRFVVNGLPAGRYLASAVDFIGDDEWQDPVFLQNLRRTAVPIELRETTSTNVTLKMEGQP